MPVQKLVLVPQIRCNGNEEIIIVGTNQLRKKEICKVLIFVALYSIDVLYASAEVMKYFVIMGDTNRVS